MTVTLSREAARLPAETWWTVNPEQLTPRSPFQSRAWLEHWLQHRGRHLEPYTLVVEGGETLAPFGRATVRGIRVLQLLGTGDSDFTGLISAREPEQAWDSVIAELARRRREWDLLHLHSVPDQAAIRAALARHLGSAGSQRVYELCPVIRIEGTWAAFLGARKKLRYEVKRWAKRLEETGVVSVEVSPLPLAGSLLEEMVSVERDSWRWELGNPAFKPGDLRNFLFAVLQDPATPARLWQLRIDGRLAATAIVLEDATRWCFYYTVYRQEYKNAGSLLLARIVEAAHDAGIRTFSLLRGDHGYKEAWADDKEAVYEIVCASNLRGKAAALLYRLRWRAASSERLRRLHSRVFRVGDRR